MDPVAVQHVYSRDWTAYLRSDLYAPESRFIGLLKKDWHRFRVLDLGVGLGRTTWFFGAIAQDYVGSDVVPIMVDKCRELFGENGNQRFCVVDASDLSQFSTASFDVVVFSAAGIDHLPIEGRNKALAEIARVLKPGGHFLFSSHNLDVFPHRPLKYWIPSLHPFRWIRSLRDLFSEWVFFRQVNKVALSPEVQHRGWAQLRDRAHGRALELLYARPTVVKTSLEDSGLTLDSVMGMDGIPLSDLSSPSKAWLLYYHCRKPVLT
jgi:SAM-dependent methyltransferase